METAPPEIYLLSLHDALPILCQRADRGEPAVARARVRGNPWGPTPHAGCAIAAPAREAAASRTTTRSSIRVDRDRKSTRLNSSHSQISYAVFCLKKKN